MTIGEKLREVRNDKNITIQELSQYSGVAFSNISLIERGMSDPQWGTIQKLSKGLDVDPVITFKELAN